MTDHLTQMLERQLAFQRRLGFNHAEMSTSARVDYVKQMYVAAVKELGEALDETSWKNWAKGEYVHSAELAAELTDVWCFIANMWFAAFTHDTPEQLAAAMNLSHKIKVEVNHKRQDTGYDGVSTKCPQCKRALDDPAVECETGTDGYHCAETGTTYLNDVRS